MLGGTRKRRERKPKQQKEKNMIQKDYIMRMIEQMGKILAKVLLNKEEGNQEEAIKAIDNSFGTLTGIDLQLLTTLSYEEIAELFGIFKDQSTGSLKCIIAAKLLSEKSDLLKDIQAEESTKNLHKALGLFLKGILNIGYTEIDMTSYYNDVKSIEKDLNGRLTTNEMFLLFEFYKKINEYDKAENYLFHLKDANYPDIKKIGLVFLQELEQDNGINLVKTGLTIDEIKESIQIFEKI